jgi:hypothetical protein
MTMSVLFNIAKLHYRDILWLSDTAKTYCWLTVLACNNWSSHNIQHQTTTCVLITFSEKANNELSLGVHWRSRIVLRLP